MGRPRRIRSQFLFGTTLLLAATGAFSGEAKAATTPGSSLESGASKKLGVAGTTAEISIVDAGADPTGVRDSTAEIQKALDSTRRVHAPAGTFRFKELRIPSDTYLFGDGEGATIFLTETEGNAFQFVTSHSMRVTFKDFTLAQSKEIRGNGIVMDDTYWWSTENVHIKGFTNNIYASRAIYHIHKRLFSERSVNGVNYWGTTGLWNTDWFNNVLTFDTCRFTDSTSTGASIKGDEILFSNPDFSKDGVGLMVYGDSKNWQGRVKVESAYIEATSTPFVFKQALVEISGGYYDGGPPDRPFIAFLRAEQSTIHVYGAIHTIDYFKEGFVLTNNSIVRVDEAIKVNGPINLDETSRFLSKEYDEGGFQIELDGFDSRVTMPVTYVKFGSLVMLSFDGGTGRSVSPQMIGRGLPAWLWPAANRWIPVLLFDSGTEVFGQLQVSKTGALTFFRQSLQSGFSVGGVKGVKPVTVSYLLK